MRHILLLVLVLVGSTNVSGQDDKKERELKPIDVPPPQEFMGPHGRGSVHIAEPTRDGLFDGTWFFVSRDEQIALWFRTADDGTIEARLQYQSLINPEAFETDWDGRAEYYISGHRADFKIDLTETDPDVIEGNWRWGVDFEDSGRLEQGKFVIYRTYDGRQLAFHFREFQRLIRRGDHVEKLEGRPVRSFVKVSKRLALWEEIF